MGKQNAKDVQSEILSKVNLKGAGKVSLQIEQEVWDEGIKLSNPHTIKLPAKYIGNEVFNLVSLGYTVTFLGQDGEVEKPSRKAKEAKEVKETTITD